MLITRWLRIRSPPHEVFRPPGYHVREQFHTTSLLHRNPPRTPVVKPLYVDTIPPTPEQLHASEIFFKTHLPTKSWTATEWRQQPHSESTYLVPEVAFLGRSNSGKSSLLNGLLFDQKLCRVGAKPGKTITMHAWSLSPVNPETRGARKGHQGDMEPKLTVLDMPGYGHGSHGEWGAAIMKYLTARRQLRRAFVLVNPLHGLKEQDLQMLELLRGNGIPHQMIACKSDRMKVAEAPGLLNAMQTQIDTHFSRKRQVPLLMTVKDILTVGGLAQSKDSFNWIESAQGLHDVRWAVLRAAGLEEYAITLAANGGIPPKAKHSQSVPTGKSTSSDERASEQQASPQKQIAIEDESSHAHTESFQTYAAREDISPVGISPEDLVSDMFNPISTRSAHLGANASDDAAEFEDDDSVTRKSSPSRVISPRSKQWNGKGSQSSRKKYVKPGVRAR